SGETGAGKSIFLQAIVFALGARAETDWIRSGAEEASVTLELDLSGRPGAGERLAALGIPFDAREGCLQLRRSLNAGGRSKAYLNDVPVNLKTLQTLSESWIHLVGQHAAQDLLAEGRLLGLLDRFAAAEAPREGYRRALRRFRECRQELDALRQRVARHREQEDFLRFQNAELEKAQLQIGEEEALEAKKNRMKHQVILAEMSDEIQRGLQEAEGNVFDTLGKLLHLARKAEHYDAGFAALRASLDQAMAPLQEAVRWVQDYRSGLQDDPEALDQLEGRLARLAELKRKYRADIPALIAKREALNRQVGELENFEEDLRKLEASLGAAAQAVREAAEALRALRNKAAGRLKAPLAKALRDLALPHAEIDWKLFPLEADEFRDDGADRLAVMVSFNPGEEKRPLAEVASGGELSRLLLALYEILFPPEDFLTLIFDEVDSGVGGKVAELIGCKLQQLSQKAQVFCVTHLAQIACHADRHYA
ncbi:MAG: DNA repair protein RecN, partial [Candidatus Binatia bacterium]